MSTPDKIKQLLISKLNALHVEIEDESYRHSTHSEAQRSGGGHYRILVVSDQFKNRSLIERQRLVNNALKFIFSREIHAFTIRALTTAEWSQKRKANWDVRRFAETYIRPESKSELIFVIFMVAFLLIMGILFISSKMTH